MNELIPTILKNLLNTNVIITSKIDYSNLSFYEDNYVFDSNISNFLCKEELIKRIESFEQENYYEIVDNLRIRLFCFKFGEDVILIGPYINKYMSDEEILKQIVKNKIAESNLLIFRNYYSKFRIVDAININKVVESVFISFYPNINMDFPYRRINDVVESLTHKIDKSHTSLNEIYHKYDIENKFLDNIRTGNYRALEQSFSYLTNLANKNTYNIYNSENNQIMLSALRTLVRKAAEQSGLSVIIIDSIVQKYTQLMTKEINVINATKYIHEFIFEITKAVSEHLLSTKDYSYYTIRVVSYLSLKYSEDIKLIDLAEYFKISPSYLEHTFKNDTKQTIKQYITKLRCFKAAELLKSNDFSVSDVSFMVGYDDQNYFTKVFKSYFHITPLKYKKLNVK